MNDRYGHVAGDSAVSLTASIGCARDEADYEKMISKADTAMYSAKHRGKNRVVCSEDFFGGTGLKKD